MLGEGGIAAAKLHVAAETGDLETARQLLNIQPDIVDLARGEMRALHMAVLRRDLAMTELLLEFGSDPDEGIWPNRDSTSPYVIARDRSYSEIVDAISAARVRRAGKAAKHADLHSRPERGLLEAAVRENRPDELLRLLDLGLDPNERFQIGHPEERTWSAGGPLLQAVTLNRIELARLLLERGADPNVEVWTSGSPAFRAYDGRNPEMIALIEQYGGWIDAGSAGYARQTEIARKMLAGEIDPHLNPNDFSGHTVAEQLLWGGASALCAEIVSMALARVDWDPEDPRWFWMLWRPIPGHEDYDQLKQAECCECFELILARCGPHHRASDYGQSMLHEVVARDHGVGVQLAAILLDAGARLDIRDKLLMSTPLGWACRWGRSELVKLFLLRGADPIEADAEPWAAPRAWAEKMNRPAIWPCLLPQAQVQRTELREVELLVVNQRIALHQHRTAEEFL